MGIFDKIIRAVKRLTGSNEPNQKKNENYDRPSATVSTAHVQNNNAQNHLTREERFAAEMARQREELATSLREIFAREYFRYSVKENVEVTALDPEAEFGGPIDFAIMDGDKIVGAVMLVEKGKKRTKRIHGVELACAKTGAGFANFYIGFNNADRFPFKREYAVDYLRRQIRI